MTHRDPGPIPSRWLNCPPLSNGLIGGQFLAFKTPLGSQFNEKLPRSKYFTPSMVFSHVKGMNMKLGLWIDLTNTSRFYDKTEVEKMDCKYVKLQCRGHGETPSIEQTSKFINTVRKFVERHPNDVIGVHCTHGFNRTGFLLTAYLIDQMDCSLIPALTEFAQMREPGIYKQDYLEELHNRYKDDDEDAVPNAPPRPDWCYEEDEVDIHDDEKDINHSASSSSQPQSNNKHRRKEKFKNKTFIPEVQGVYQVTDESLLSDIRKKAQVFCKWQHTNFPGSQPVSMDRQNISLLGEKPYMVSWKADGVRYMMLIDGEDQVYMIDRDNCVFQVKNLRFFHNTKGTHLTGTLLDGEMVIDNKDGHKIRYLCYDVIRFEGMNVGKEAFYPTRLMCIEKEIVNPRNRAIESGKIDKNAEPFRVVLKQFWDVSTAHTLLSDKFARTLSHEPDGLIFQPSTEPYTPGPCHDVLKWKPPEMNSIDFKLKIVQETGLGMLPEKKGCLYVNGMPEPFAVMKVSKLLKEYDNKIIECKFENNKWVFMRERTDKSFPNKYETAIAVWNSIKHPVTQEDLLSYINRYAFRSVMQPGRHH